MSKHITNKLWNDPVWSKVIAFIIISILTYLTNLVLTPIFDGELNSNNNEESSITTFSPKIIFIISFFLSIFIVFITINLKNYFTNWRQKQLHKLYFSQSGKLLTLEYIEKRLIKINKIAICGIGSVGKTTLIENLCSEPNKNELTQGVGCYVINFGKNQYKYAALLDGSGQSNATQNDLAVKARILIIMLDHNETNNLAALNRGRLDKHKSFIKNIVDRLKTSEKEPSFIFLLLNKQDLWNKLRSEDKKEIQDFFSGQCSYLKDSFRNTKIFKFEFSNEVNQNRTLIFNQLSQIIN